MTPGRILLWGAGGLLVASVAGVAIGEMTGWPFLRHPLQNAMARAAGVPVTLAGDFRARLLGPPRLTVGHLRVAPAHDLPVPHLLDATDVTLAWRWSDVWNWRRTGLLRIRSLDAQVLDANLLRAQDGRASWQLGTAPTQSRNPAAQETLQTVPRFGRLQVARGRLSVNDVPMQTRLVAEFRGGEGEAWSDGTPIGYRATVTGHYRALPLKLQAASGGALPLIQDSEADARSATVPLRVEGEVGATSLGFDGQAGALMGEQQLSGSLRFRGPSLAQVGEPLGLTLPQTPPFDLSGQLDHAKGVWRLQAQRIAVGRSLLNGDFRYDTHAEPGRLTGRLAGPLLVLADLAPAIGKAGPASERSGRVLPQRRFDLPSLKAMDADVQVAIDRLDFGSEALAPLQSLQTRLRLDQGLLHLRELQAGVAGGQVRGETSLDARTEPARWRVDLHLSGIDVANWVRGVQTPRGEASAARRAGSRSTLQRERQRARQGGDQPVQAYLTGALDGKLHAAGAGRSTAEILASLNGDSQVLLRDGTLSYLITEMLGLDVAQALGVMLTGDKPLPLRCARLDLVVRNGVVKPRVAVLDNADSTVRVQGQLDLRDESLALRATSRPKDFSPLSLRSPITVLGTLAAPVVGIDGGKLAGKALGALALGALIAPPAALLALMDTGTDDQGDPCTTTPQAVGPAASAKPGTAVAPETRTGPAKAPKD